MTLFRLYTEGTRILERSGVRDAAIDARQLLLAAFNVDITHYLLNRMQDYADDDFHRSAEKLYRQMLARRARRVPLQQILRTAEFMGLSFFVNRFVLIPRQDTETLVELVLRDCGSAGFYGGLSLLDLCTGSGCVALSLAVKGDFSRVDAVDISEEALDVARKNAAALLPEDGISEKITFYQGNLFDALPSDQKSYDIIVSNPPYIPTDVIASLEPEVRDHEPALALDGRADGLYYYREIAAGAGAYLAEAGRMYLEIGCEQGKAVCGILRDAGYRDVKIYQDLSGRDRVVCAKPPLLPRQ